MTDAAPQNPRLWSPGAAKILAAIIAGSIGACGGGLGIWGVLESRIGSGIALAQDVEDLQHSMTAETVERVAEVERLDEACEATEARVAAVEQMQAAQDAHLRAIDAQLEDIKRGQEKQLELLIKIAQD